MTRPTADPNIDWGRANDSGLRSRYTLACFRCRVTAKASYRDRNRRRCPQCRASLVNCGKSFSVPKRPDIRGCRSAGWLFVRNLERTTTFCERRGDKIRAEDYRERAAAVAAMMSDLT
jgi:hypothetical protein